MRKYLPDYCTVRTFKWPTAIVIGLIHVAALAAPFTFSWTGLILCLVLYYMSGGLGITLCYHRFLTHSSFKTYAPVKWFITTCAVLAFQGNPTSWVSAHRVHHKESDHEPDPHSPVVVNFLWGHILWLFWRQPGLATREEEQHYTKDLQRDAAVRFFDKSFLLINILFAAGLYGAGYLIAGPAFGTSLLVWGFFLRIVLCWHGTWLVNSATHLWGYSNYTTDDNSKNNWWVALLSFGEGWHNNHHADQRSAAHGHKWWEFDLTYVTIRLLEKLGLAWDVVVPRNMQKMDMRKAA
ncbi:MAG: stearoyl-CoA 9-desaturase [Candidatus Hydrogenedentota bacterium]